MSNRWKVVSTLSPSLNSDWLGDIKLFLVENLHILIHYSFKYFSGYVKQRHGMVIFQYLLISFYMCRNYICFFPFNRKFCTFKTWFNYWFKWLQRVASQLFSIQILIMTWPWALNVIFCKANCWQRVMNFR